MMETEQAIDNESAALTTEVEVESASSNQSKLKLPYFHRTLSEEEQQLIGDITPKKIEVENDIVSASVDQQVPTLVQGSAWNAAKIWEEKDHTPWAKEHVRELFCSDALDFQHGSVLVTVTDSESVTGFANLTCSRGKPRYMYSLAFTLKVDVEVGGETFVGSVAVDDVVNDMLDDMELSVTWTKRPTNALWKECNTSTTGKPMKEFIKSKMKTFEGHFRDL